MDHDDTTRYGLELDMLERDGTLSNPRAIDLLRSELALALNASYLMGLSGDDIQVRSIWRSVPQEGVARYAVELALVERDPAMSDEQAADLVRSEFQRAQNASHFLRICGEDFTARLVSRERDALPAQLRAA